MHARQTSRSDSETQRTRQRMRQYNKCIGFPQILLFSLILCVLAISCTKEDTAPEGMVRLKTEPLNSSSKVYVDDTRSGWQSGDAIVFSNGTEATVTEVDNHWYISSTGIADGMSAVYPADIVSDGILTLPDTYQYNTNAAGQQVIAMPMAAYYDGSGTLYFKHLTGGLYFRVKNNTGNTVKIDRITVENASYYMSGETLAMSDITATFLSGDRAFVSSGNEVAKKRVSLLFNEGLTLENLAEKMLLVPVPAFANDAAFTITVYAHNGTVSRYLFNQTQSAAHTGHISASEVGYANISLGSNEGATPFEGNGSYGSPYQIYTKEDYKRMVDSVNGANGATYRNKHYVIAADIDMCGETVNGLRDFAGVIDGKGHTISHVCFSNRGNNNDTLGMVSTILNENKDTIRNLTLDYVSFAPGGKYVGAFVGYAQARWTYVYLINCHVGHVTYNTLASTAIVGGMIGQLSKTGTAQHNSWLVDCSIDQPLTLTTSECTNLNFGGFIGAISYNTSVQYFNNCTLNAHISVDAPNAKLNFGGIIGLSGGQSTYNDCNVKSGTHFTAIANGPLSVGALIGEWSNYRIETNDCQVQSEAINCTMMSSSNCNIGGLVGNAQAGTNHKYFNNSSVSGTITVTKANATATSFLGQVCGIGGTHIHWNDTERGNSAAVTIAVTNDGSVNDNTGIVYGNE